MTIRVPNRFFWLAAGIGLVLDQVTKQWVANSFEALGDRILLFPGIFHLTYVVNTGAAFSLFAGGAHWLRWLSLLVSIILIVLAWTNPRLPRLEQLGWGFILSGAIGNGVCRFVYSYVIDFLEFPFVRIPVLNWAEFSWRWVPFPVFNFADVFINLGIILLLLNYLKNPSPPQRPARSGSE
ncbi:MAG: lipoprotein signal peptidase [Spirulinaceae cyanobacterium RM2_2_10]|nr:lipoprotein signal peptidase [Spirulinaceae cyanobacterium SM2_1_0]NJO20098.1 lipoprotein signal peptidase [Spirulinaceae cyanobacterium RM2_2_10]